MLSPTLPAWIWLTRTAGPWRAVNWSIMICRWIGGVLPVSGPTARSARARRATGQPETLRQRNTNALQ